MTGGREGGGGSGGGAGELTMSSIYEQEIYSNGDRSGIFVWHVVHHVPQSTKLQSVADTSTEPGPGILLLVRSAMDDAWSFSRTGTHKGTRD